MEICDHNRPSVNPRPLVRTQGKLALADLLANTGYVPQPQVLNVVALGLRRCKPVLLGGHRGGGKTATAEALAQACNLTMFYVPGIEGQETHEVYGGWDREAQLDAFKSGLSSGQSREEAEQAKWSEECFNRGEILEAYAYAKAAAENNEAPPVLVIDEVEKLSLKLQNTLLQPLARGWANVPKLRGIIGVREREHSPIVILTSNNLRALSDPLKSRCEVAWVELPTPLEEILILRSRVPAASPVLLAGVVKILYLIRSDMPEVRDKPALRESIDLLEAFVEDGVDQITEDVLLEYLSCLGKDQKELINLAAGIGRLEDAANTPNIEVEELLETAFNRDITEEAA
ncbi:MAG TPA: MoxR family ATPase [Blastocatellia bacterium]|nr:MoxR family ATPase [Blastocatellia bacterium]